MKNGTEAKYEVERIRKSSKKKRKGRPEGSKKFCLKWGKGKKLSSSG